MRVAIAINTSWNIFNFRKGLVTTLLRDGHEVVAIAPYDQYVRHLTAWGCEYEPLEVTSTGINPIREIRSIFRFRHLLRKHRIDVLLSYTIKFNIYGILAARSVGIPIICNVSGLGTVFLQKGLASAAGKLLYKLTFPKASHVFFQNPDDQREFERVARIDRDKTSLLPGSGIDLKEFERSPYSPGSPVVFLMIGRLLIEKGVKEFVEAATAIRKAYPGTIFRMIGKADPSHSRTIPKEILQRWISEGLIDYKPHTDSVREEIVAADVVVLPSYREGMSRTLLEGAAIGRPLIATDVPGCREVVEHEVNGFLCRVRDANDLAQKMQRFIQLPAEDKQKMAQAGRKKIEEQFDEKIVIDAYMQKVHELWPRK